MQRRIALLATPERFKRRAAHFGRFNSLSQILLKMTSPGVPDLYQGTELWDLNLVDPDNRRPVDYSRRRKILDDLRERSDPGKPGLLSLAQELLGKPADGRIKLYLIYRLLQFRRLYPEFFVRGEYHPLEAVGEKKDHVVAFARTWEKKTLIVLVARLVVGLTGGGESSPRGRMLERYARFCPLFLEEPGLQEPFHRGRGAGRRR